MKTKLNQKNDNRKVNEDKKIALQYNKNYIKKQLRKKCLELAKSGILGQALVNASGASYLKKCLSFYFALGF